MGDDNSNSGGSGRSLPPSRMRPSGTPRIGRIGDLAGDNNGGGGRGGSRFGSIGGLRPSGGGGGMGGDDDDDDDDDEKGENWFTGGERSGLSVQNPGRQSQVPGGDMVQGLLRRAAEQGASPEVPRSTVFSGAGHTLGSDEVESSYIPDPHANQNVAIRHLTFWRDGFTVEDGELYRYDDPSAAGILAQIDAGNAPPSILNVASGQQVEVRVTKRTNEEYVPTPRAKAFLGEGQRLGAPVPSDVPQSSMPGTFPAPLSSGATIPPPRESITTRFELDQTLPNTSVQIRLADGTRMVCRMNLTHKVQDLRNFINASRPENLTRPYTIGTTFPNRILDDVNATIESAGLVNSVIVQRWI